MQLKLLNLSRKLTENDLKQLFSEYGDVVSCTLVKDPESGQSKGFGFIEMSDKASATKAIEGLHKTKQKGERIRVKLSD